MTAEIRQLETPPGPGRMATPQLRTLVVCDIADSTALVERMGDQTAANLIRKHDRLARALVEQHRGREIDKTDGFLLMFDRPIQAAAFALDYQRALKHMSAADGVMVRARVGIHMGDVVIWENAPEDVTRGAKPIEVEGLVKPVAARLAQLAQPQQILMSSAAAGIAHRAAAELGADAASRVRWKNHGKYNFKGLPDPLEVIEVGEDNVAPLRAPKSGRTAKKIQPWWRRPMTLVSEAAVLAIGIGVGAWFLLQSPPTLAFAARDWVVVGDLHNLTGDKLFDQSVDSALRISLEQSQYVNVLPEQSVQQTLQRMELNPEKTDVTRAIGSQVALREGARALILPTVADVGGRVRVTAEVIDPNTQATVYSVSADGVGDGSVLPSLDSVSKQLRGKLGEALAMVSKQSMPLAQVATPNLNALRAYSLGERAYNEAHFKDAESLFNEALRVDPHFALARIKLAKIYEARDKPADAFVQIQLAQADHSRLSAREALYVDAWADNYTAPRKALEEWKLLTAVYPDYFPGLGTYAFFLWNNTNNFKEAIPYLEQASSRKNPHRAMDEYILGAMYVEDERYTDAIRAFSSAIASGLRSQGTYYASAYAAQREFSKMAAIMKSIGAADNDVVDENVRVAIKLDQGYWVAANELLNAHMKASHRRAADEYEATSISLHALDGTPAKMQISALTDYVSRVHKALALAKPAERAVLKFQVVLAGYLAARAGDPSLAKHSLAVASVEPSDTELLQNVRSVAEAQIQIASGSPQNAIEILKPLVNGSELYVTHIALMDAYSGANDNVNALVEARWLVAHRGRAYLENSVQQIMTPFNVAESDLALLSEAQFSLVAGDKPSARKALRAFSRTWPDFSDSAFAAKRYEQLAREL
ncbi:MAG TPA: putative peptide modification system cyclase [Rhodanobacteraceae bacterium]